jgi:hypothetical protein
MKGIIRRKCEMICLHSDGNLSKEDSMSRTYRPHVQWGNQIRKFFIGKPRITEHLIALLLNGMII